MPFKKKQILIHFPGHPWAYPQTNVAGTRWGSSWDHHCHDACGGQPGAGPQRVPASLLPYEPPLMFHLLAGAVGWGRVNLFNLFNLWALRCKNNIKEYFAV